MKPLPIYVYITFDLKWMKYLAPAAISGHIVWKKNQARHRGQNLSQFVWTSWVKISGAFSDKLTKVHGL